MFSRSAAARALDVTPANDTTFDLPCQAAILIDQDSGTVLYEKNADEQRPIASITKVMTLLLTFEALENGRIARDEYVPVSEHAYSMGGQPDLAGTRRENDAGRYAQGNLHFKRQ